MKKIIIFMLLMSVLWLPTNSHASKKIKMGEFKITAYCPCYECSEGYGRLTSTRKYARSQHTIAVDPSVISYGAKVKVGDTIYVAEDCGGKVKGDHIDVFFDTHEEVKEFGTKYKEVWVIK